MIIKAPRSILQYWFLFWKVYNCIYG